MCVCVLRCQLAQRDRRVHMLCCCCAASASVALNCASATGFWARENAAAARNGWWWQRRGDGSGWQVIFRGLKRNQLQVDSEVYYSSQPVSIPPRPAKIHPPSTFRCQPGPRPAGSCQIRQHHQTCAHTLRTFSIVCLCKSDVTDATTATTTATTMPTKALTRERNERENDCA